MRAVAACSCARLVFALSIGFLSAAVRRDGSTEAVTAGVLLIADAPADDFDEVNITVTRAELLRDGGQAVSISLGGRVVNLLALQDRPEVFSLAAAPGGAYSGVSLAVSAIELVKRDPRTGKAMEVVRPRLPDGGRLELSPRTAFAIPAGGTLILQLGLDARRSIHLTAEGRCGAYLVHPLVVDADGTAPVPATHRMSPGNAAGGRPTDPPRPRGMLEAGTLDAVDAEAGTFAVLHSGGDPWPRGLAVCTGARTAVFLVAPSGAATRIGLGGAAPGWGVVVQGRAGADGRFDAHRVLVFAPEDSGAVMA